MNRLVLASVLILGACGQAAETDDVLETVETEGIAAPAVTPEPPTSDATSPATPAEATIPPALQGRWGMVAADCTSTRGDAKGLLTISPTTLKFYESVGQLGAIKERTGNSIRAEYTFTGEGMEWTRDVELSVTGDTLTRTDRGGDEPGGPFTYTRCAG